MFAKKVMQLKWNVFSLKYFTDLTYCMVGAVGKDVQHNSLTLD